LCEGVVISHRQVSYPEAKEKCGNKNMSLLSTETPEEKDALSSLLAQNGLIIIQFINKHAFFSFMSSKAPRAMNYS
jgi:hypothetical protein